MVAITIIVLPACKKKVEATPGTGRKAEYYLYTAEFSYKYGAALQTLTLNAATGKGFTTPQGKVANIPAKSFITQSGTAVTGNVHVDFKNIYRKSDMLLSYKRTLIKNSI